MSNNSETNILLEDIKALLLLVNQEKLEEAKHRLLKAGSVENQIYDNCDGNSTTHEIAARVQKTPEYVNAVISTLRRKGLVRTITTEGKKVHEQRF